MSQAEIIEKLKSLYARYEKRIFYDSKEKDLYEQDTATKFIKPMLEILGWNIYDVSEVREQVPVKINNKRRTADCVLYCGKHCIVLEFKGTGIKSLGSNERFKDVLIAQAKQLNARYAVLTSYFETIVFDPKTNERLACFDHPKKYISNLENLLRYLSKEHAMKNDKNQ